MSMSLVDMSSSQNTHYKDRRYKFCVFRPDHWTYRYVILILVCTVKFSQNYIFDIPAGLEQVIIQTLNIDVSRYALLYSIYSWPNVVFTVVGGILVDQFLGARLGLLLFMVVSTIGQLVMALGGFFNTFWLMVVGRFVIGLGGELALITTNAFAAVWFKGKEITFVFALLGTCAGLGGVCGIYLNEVLYDYFKFVSDKHIQLGITLSVSFGMMVLFCILSFVLLVMDKRAEKILKRHNSTEKGFSLRDFKSFNINYWLVLVITVSYFASYYPFIAVAQLFYTSKFGLSVNQANIANVITYAVQIFSPLFGLMIDLTGFHMFWGLIAALPMLGAHVLLLLSNGSFYIPFVASSVIGISHSCYCAAMWVAPALLVKEHQLSTAYGLFEAVLNIGYAVINLIAGHVIDKYGYFAQEVIFICFQVVGILLLILLILRLLGTENLVNVSGLKCRKANTVNDLQDESKTVFLTSDCQIINYGASDSTDVNTVVTKGKKTE